MEYDIRVFVNTTLREICLKCHSSSSIGDVPHNSPRMKNRDRETSQTKQDSGVLALQEARVGVVQIRGRG